MPIGPADEPSTAYRDLLEPEIERQLEPQATMSYQIEREVINIGRIPTLARFYLSGQSGRLVGAVPSPQTYNPQTIDMPDLRNGMENGNVSVSFEIRTEDILPARVSSSKMKKTKKKRIPKEFEFEVKSTKRKVKFF